jgi:cell division protein FtsB
MDWPLFRWGRLREQAEYEPATDARPAEEEPARGGCVDPERQRKARLRRGVLVLCLTTLFLAGSLVALVGRGGYVDLHRKREEARMLREEVATLRVNVGVLDHVVGRLEAEPLEQERIAREQLGLVLPGEIDFLLPRNAAGEPAAPPSGPAQSGQGSATE